MNPYRDDVSEDLVVEAARIVADAAGSRQFTAGIGSILDRLREATQAAFALMEFEQDGCLITCYSSTDAGIAPGKRESVETSIAGLCLKVPEPIVATDISTDARFDRCERDASVPPAMISIPLSFDGRRVGTLRMHSEDPALCSDDNVQLAQLLASASQRILLRALRESDVTSSSVVGGGLWALRDRRKAQLWRAGQHDYVVSVVTCDIKGYLTKDILEKVTQRVRSTDVWYQQDAGRFAIVMPGTPVEDAAKAAERIKHEIESLAAASGEQLFVTCYAAPLRDRGADQKSA